MKERKLSLTALVKSCDPNFEVNIFQILKVATNETSTLH